MSTLEHVNLTVKNPQQTADLLCTLFDWTIRWSGKSMNGGDTIHVGEAEDGASYLALYAPPKLAESKQLNSSQLGHLNHIAVVVDDLDVVEQRAKSEGFATFNHGDYHPGRRFYLQLSDEIEAEVVTYQA